MNGRLYDPVIARFFSPDTYVQNPYFTQNFNRYSYALNNPLKYVDRTGQWYDDYGDYYNANNYDDGDGPKKPMNFDDMVAFGREHGLWDVEYLSREDTDPSDGHPDNNLYRYNDPANWFEPFDYEGQSGPGDGDTPKLSTSYNTGLPTVDIPKQDYSGFWGTVKYFWTGGIADGYKYNMDGNVIGFAPIMGNPPVPAFKGGNVIKGLKTLQTGKHTLNSSTLKALKLTGEQGKKAIEALKDDLGLPHNFHGTIRSNGDYLHPHTGKWLGNLFEYLY